MPGVFKQTFDTPTFKGSVTVNTGLFINGKFVDGVKGETHDVINPATGKVITPVSAGTKEDVDIAVAAARKAYKTSWGLKCPGLERGKLLNKLADLIEENADELAALETINVGKAFLMAKNGDIPGTVQCLRYYAGWADKNQGKTIEADDSKLIYTRHEPIGVVGQIIPWNFPLQMLSWKIGPALATGNSIVLKPSEFTPLSALRLCDLISQAGFPPGVINIITGLGSTVGQAISEHMQIEKVAFTGSTFTGRKIMDAAAKSNLKKVTLELGGKNPALVFDDADLDQAVKWAAFGLYLNQGQACASGSRVYVQSGIYDQFVEKFTNHVKSYPVGDPFAPTTYHGAQVSEIHYNRIMSYIESGKEEGATVQLGGKRFGNEGFFIEPTIFTNTNPNMRIVKEEIFGPVIVLIKFDTEEEVIQRANDTMYGLSAAVYTKDIQRALRVTHELEAGTCWINMSILVAIGAPFGGFKQSGIGRELGEYALANYTNVKAVHANISHMM